ncbi:xanthine dehydrogenase, molybdenum binding subunit apoprotein [Dethiosulfatibacter aminovorans DSM 17477]|uniref:Xanthine dehydrogenase, molybdenum binding subunit apoprotein n=2 Tax=Dethiosulfatibacter TaxID=448125 RepID=A0A1M6HBF3_9FIRM|nr:xanthine dehydrogenase, molybdenum binding subunit apoprotein [Dethiosulfatibacter aminovorans DSM 17477]
MKVSEKKLPKILNVVNQPIPKRDGRKLVTGAAVYTDDLAPADALVVKVLRSKHHFAEILNIDTEKAEKVEGVECILTYRDVPDVRITRAGQTYPEPSPLDWKILDKYVRYIGDEVAVVAARTEEQAERALRLIKVDYRVMEPVLDYKTAAKSKSIVHFEKDSSVNYDIGFEPERNIAAHIDFEIGDYEKGFRESEIILEREYETQATNPAMMEPVTTFTYLDEYDRMTVVSATQVPFHVRRMIAKSLDIPVSRVRVKKPRIGGGFGLKQTAASEFFPALVTLRTGKAAKIYYSRKEVFLATSRRHPFVMKVRIGANRDGRIRAFDFQAISDTGAFGEHASTVIEACGEKIMAMYNKVDGYRFDGTAVYTNLPPSGAFRGYGKTQGLFAVESIVNELAKEIGMDPTELRKRNLIKKGENLLLGTSHVYGDDILRQDSCELDFLIDRGKELIGWDENYPGKDMGNRKFRGVGMALSIQASGVLNIDSANATLKFNSDGFFTLLISATDMGTGCDTILSQMAAEALQVPLENIAVYAADTDVTPYDDGSYASSSTYVTGRAVVEASEKILEKLKKEVSEIFDAEIDEIEYENGVFTWDGSSASLSDLGYRLNCRQVMATGSHTCSTEAPPYKSGFALVEVDAETGKVDVLECAGVVDCGTVINTNLCTVQAQGGILQGIGMALYEDINHDFAGREMNDSFMTYKIPTRKDAPKIMVDFAKSYEPTGPYGAKSIGEVVLNAAAPAIADAIDNAIGVRFRKLPITPEKVFFALNKDE